MTKRYRNIAGLTVLAAALLLASSAVMAQHDSSVCNSPLATCGPVVVPEYIAPSVINRRASSRKLAGSRSLLSSGPILTIYEDEIPWSYYGENGARAGLATINKVFGQDYFVQTTYELANLNIAHTQIAWISSAAIVCTRETNLPTAQPQLFEFLKAGGVVVLDATTNCASAGVVPKPDGSPLKPTLLSFFIYNDQGFGHGPARLPANQAPTSLVSTPYSLEGITGSALNHAAIPPEQLPAGATVHLLDDYGRIIMATYKVGAGTVLVDTITKEFNSFYPDNRVVMNLLQFAYDEANANTGCTANDDLCNNCKTRAAGNPAALGSVGSCYNCAQNLANSWQCYQCMSSSNNPDVVSGCLKCIADGVPAWSCPQWCAAAATTGEQMSKCETCLTKPGINTWGCFNCLSMAKGDVTKSNQCNQCLYDGRDPWSCGQCLLKRDSTAIDTCFKCLPAIGGDTYPCLSA